MKIIIRITGQKRHGKDTVAEALYDEAVCLRFAGPLKDAVAQIYGLTYEQVMGYDYDREQPIERLGGLSVRQILQRFGTEVARNVHPSTWVWAMRRQIESSPYTRYVIPDVRFLNEAQGLRDIAKEVGAKCEIWRVIRPGLPASEDTHASEVEQLTIPVDRTIINDDGLLALYAASRDAFDVILNA